MTMTEAPCSAASMDAGRPEAPAPTTTTSATLSQWRATTAAWALCESIPVRAVAPIPANAALTKSLRGRLFSFFFMLQLLRLTDSCIPRWLESGDFRRTGFSLSALRLMRQKSKPDRLKPVLLAARHQRLAANFGDRGRSGLR